MFMAGPYEPICHDHIDMWPELPSACVPRSSCMPLPISLVPYAHGRDMELNVSCMHVAMWHLLAHGACLDSCHGRDYQCKILLLCVGGFRQVKQSRLGPSLSQPMEGQGIGKHMRLGQTATLRCDALKGEA